VYPKLLDFGISKAVKKQGELRSAVTTEEGFVLGTPEYMSPEQARGLPDIDVRSDLYSLGVVMYEALVGHAPFESPNQGDLMVMVIAGGAPPVAELVPEVGAALSQVIEGAMASDRQRRFVSAEAMRAALVAASDSLPSFELPRHVRRATDVAPKSRIEQALSQITPLQRARGASRVLPVAGFGLVLALAAGVVAYALRATQRAEPRYIVVQGGAQAGSSAPSPDEPVPSATPPEVAAAGEAAVAGSSGTASTAAGTTAQPAAEAPTAPTRAPRPSPTPVAARPNDPATAVARAFEAQKAGVVRCLSQHAADVPADSELSVRISLSPEGVVKSAAVLPEALGQSGAGSCIATVVRSMSFPTQPGPVAVRVPLTARRK
jgi:serine/threonine-protein kinase